MKNIYKIVAFLIVVIVLISAFAVILFLKDEQNNDETDEDDQFVLPYGISAVVKTYNFSGPLLEEKEEFIIIRVDQTDYQSMGDGRPVLPYNLTMIEFPFGTEILDINFTYSEPEIINISKKVSYASHSTLALMDKNIYYSNNMYPSNFVTYHTGAGLSNNEHKTFLNIRINPVTYKPLKNEINFVKQVKIKILYKEPEKPLLKNDGDYDMLIISPEQFTKNLQPLIEHKEKQDIETRLVTVEEIYKNSKGRDEAEQIKYYIKESIEDLGIKSVLLVGGLDGQSSRWNIPVRYSHVLIREGTQENLEPSYLSDLYFADIYNSQGNFSSWDTNHNDIFGEYDKETIDEMDLYPDVQIGRLPCRNTKEVKAVVNKIIKYENNEKGEWFDNLILVSGDHWPDKNNIAEGILIMQETKDIMSGFNPVEIYATENNKIMIRDINKAINNGAGFAYFCGHGSPSAWGIHYPPDATGWAPSFGRLGLVDFYKPMDMNFLRNKYKLPVTIVGGCNNGQFDISIANSLKEGKIKLTTNCWAWKLTSLPNGGAIATIANTALGTHAKDDTDYNDVNDYLEVYDGWLELKFFKLYSEDKIDILGQLHQEAITNYLHVFLGNNDEMDTKMVQQWVLLGDPSIIIG